TAPVVVITSPADGSQTRVNVTVVGRVSDNLSGVAKLEAQMDNGSFSPASFDSSGAYSFLTQLPGDGSADGLHSVHIRATDQAGNVSPVAAVTFTLDTIPPAVSFDLDPSTDSDPVGDGQTTFASVILTGQTEPNLAVKLVETGATTTADASGRFQFPGVSLALGSNPFHVQA